MYAHILLPTDGSELSERAARHGIELAKRLGARVTAMIAIHPFADLGAWPGVPTLILPEYTREAEERARAILDKVAAEAASAGVTCATLQVEHPEPYRAIIEAAGANGCDLIVMASHGRRGLSALVLGSETVKVLTHTALPVLVYR